ncbi:class I SAM-dependent methyltransferase [Leucobacter sp. L43]|uniref:class I SAM-dependent methyltransferase n=1 Tax=Leucobacter sp. L43 TaxID=2798040 RepID=UPI001903E2C9|nr:class I SAM-dependent methyltransferase [Leucobacter sp. L43]
MSATAIRRSYDARAAEYADLFASVDAAPADDVAEIREWAARCSGPLIDAGCGPGHWTDDLRRQGAEISGFDLSPAFVEIARQRFPHSEYRVADLARSGVATASAGGILSWFSLIHTPPAEVDAVLAEFARILAPGGRLLLGAFAWPELEPFAHAVVTAYRWPPGELGGRLVSARFELHRVSERTPEGARPQCSLEARRAEE